MSHEDRIDRRALTVRVFPLGGEPGDDLSASTTAEERLLMVDVLSRRMWEFTGQTAPTYVRQAMPVRVRPLK